MVLTCETVSHGQRSRSRDGSLLDLSVSSIIAHRGCLPTWSVRDFRLSPSFCLTAVKIGVVCVISAFEWSLICRPVQESRAVAEKPHDAVVKFNT